MAQGSDETLRALRTLCPAGTPFVGYGHRVSFGVVCKGSTNAAAGFAKDVLLYDQGGCLSPQTIFVEGGWQKAQRLCRTSGGSAGGSGHSIPLACSGRTGSDDSA